MKNKNHYTPEKNNCQAKKNNLTFALRKCRVDVLAGDQDIRIL